MVQKEKCHIPEMVVGYRTKCYGRNSLYIFNDMCLTPHIGKELRHEKEFDIWQYQ